MAPRASLPVSLWRRLFAGRLPADDAAIADQLDSIGHPDLADEAAFLAATRADTDLRVVVFGEYNVGKSTLVNALVGRQVLAARLRPTTGVPAEVRAGADRVRIATRDGRETAATLAEADRASSLDTDARVRDQVDRILIDMPSPLLSSGIALIDTPGILDAEAQTERARREVSAADVVLLVLRADHLLSRTERDYALAWLTVELKKPVVPVVNFMSRVPEAERGELRASLGLAGAPAPADDTTALIEDLGRIGARRAEVKAASRAGWQASWQRRARAANAAMLVRLGTAAEAVAAAREREAREIARRAEALPGALADARARANDFVARFRRGGAEAAIDALPADTQLLTAEARTLAAAAVAGRLVRAQALIDAEADAILGRLAAGSGVMLDPLSVRELAALDIPPAATLDAAAEGTALTWAAGALGLTLWYGLAWKIALPVALVGWLVGRGAATVSRQISEFREGLAANADRSLERMAGMLAAGIDARGAELARTLARRLAAARSPPSATEELRIRRHLAKVLGAGET